MLVDCPRVAAPLCHVAGSRMGRAAARLQSFSSRVAVGGAPLNLSTRRASQRVASVAAAPEARMHGLAKYVEQVEKEQLKTNLIDLKIGMTLKVGVTVIESGKSRVQPYQGLLIAMHKNGLNSTITVRKIFQGVGVERVFPIHSPLVAIEAVPTAGVPRVRRAKLYYLRDRVGKAARLKQTFVSKAAPSAKEEAPAPSQ